MSFSGWKESELGKIPVEWEVVKIDEIADVISGGTPSTKKSEYYGDEIAWITPKDLSGYTSKYISRGERSITNLGLENSSAKLLPPNTVLFSSRAPIGYVAISRDQLTTNQGFKNLVCDSTKADFEFMYYKMKTLKEALESVAGGSTFKEVSGKVVKEFNIVLPTLPEQKAIANIFASLDEKIELNNQMNKTLEEMAQALFKRWFVDFEFPNENGEPYKSSGGEMVDSELGMIPKGWKVGYLDDIIEIYDAKRKPLSSRQRANMAKNYPYYGAASLVDYVENYLFDGIYVLISEDGANVVDADGYPLVQYVWDKFWVNNHAHIVKGKNGYSEEHIYILVKNTNMRSIVTGAVQPKINQANLKSVNIVIAQAIIIEKFNDLLTSVFNQYRSNAIENEKLKEMRDILLPKLMSGEIRVTDLQN